LTATRTQRSGYGIFALVLYRILQPIGKSSPEIGAGPSGSSAIPGHGVTFPNAGNLPGLIREDCSSPTERSRQL
jgi:hypothetical protein